MRLAEPMIAKGRSAKNRLTVAPLRDDLSPSHRVACARRLDASLLKVGQRCGQLRHCTQIIAVSFGRKKLP